MADTVAPPSCIRLITVNRSLVTFSRLPFWEPHQRFPSARAFACPRNPDNKLESVD
jgi:hypothetical protein